MKSIRKRNEKTKGKHASETKRTFILYKLPLGAQSGKKVIVIWWGAILKNGFKKVNLD